jgi:hypothetical protein
MNWNLHQKFNLSIWNPQYRNSHNASLALGRLVSKPSSQGRLEGATGMYSCVFETKRPNDKRI